MTIWKSEHPNLNIPIHCTTYQHFFEETPNLDGAYENVTTRERLSFIDVKRKAEILSTILVERYGLQPGQTVSLFSGNTIWYPVGIWATLRAGGRVNGASPSYNVAETEHALRTAATKVLLTLPGSLDVAREAAIRVGIPESNILLLEGEAKGIASMQKLIDQAECDTSFHIMPTWQIPAGKSNKDVCGYLNFSSGTTGLPKAVMLSHGNIIAQCYQLRQLQVLSKPVLPSPEHPHGLPAYRILAIMPLFHITGLVRFVSYPVFMSGLSAMLPTFTLPTMLEAIIRYRMEELILVPPILIRLVQDSTVDPYLSDLRRTVKRWSSGSAPIAPEVIKALQRKFPDTGFRQGYGATESTACISAHPPSHFDYKYAHTGGKLVANTIAKVVALAPPDADPATHTTKEVLLGPREVGEICAKGPQICMGYLGNEAATKEAFDKEGFLHTGDVGYIDEEGLIVISDRIKEMIKVRGQQVAPAELEDLLLGHELVEDCAVIGVKDTYSGELPKGFVVLKNRGLEGVGAGRKLLEYIQSRVVGYKRIREIEFVDAVPKSPTGKLLRRILKGWERGEDDTRMKGTIVREQVKEKARL
ncbi:acetyl-CoA synthetase-like protein [Tothia fuscella]|uniref:Acetyl-CoA synthetase-like protein n=1 Tax=Tothia fuscella TaxID=1048955 RepID=A0A9P4TVT0_9PEZI|nr:acetyl-CoA synthetase-like protein [Tothia fuscella]